MAKTPKKENLAKTEKELEDLLKNKRDDLFQLRLDLSQFKLKNTRQIFSTRKEIARILTVLKEKELALPKGENK